MPFKKKSASASPAAPSTWTNLYGICPGIKLADWQSEAWCFKTNPVGGFGRFQHLKNWLALTWPREVQTDRWNPWTELLLKEFCSDENAHIIGSTRIKVTCLTGAAACSKTHTAGLYAFCYFACSPANTIVMATSTTKDMVKKRIWPVIQHFHDTAETGPRLKGSSPWEGVLNKVDSQTTIKFVPQSTDSNNDKNAIFAMAVAHGETQKAASNLRGLHDVRMLLLIDEANDTPEAIFETIPNQLKGCQNYEIIVIGNPVSHMDAHGQACSPAEGWGIINETRYKWRTKGVDKWELESGTCLRFDGKESPNVKLGRDQWPFLYTCANWSRACRPEKEKTLAYWSQSRGLWPPDGTCNVIISESMLEKYDPLDGIPFVWKSHKEMSAFLDPGFGGDACKLAFGEIGDIESGKTALQITEIIELRFELAAKDERDYLIARQTIEECKARGVRSSHFGLDRTGTGRGVAAILCAEWSNEIVQVEYGSMATERPSSTADGRPSREVYFNRVTEMWWSAREFLEAGQLRGIPLQARIELSTREYSWAGRRYKLESKEDYKKRVSTHSPDDGDAVTGLVDVVRAQGVNAQTKNTDSHNEDARRELKAASVSQQHNDYSPANEQEELEYALQGADSSVAEALESW